jgi:hypothetical protein
MCHYGILENTLLDPDLPLVVKDHTFYNTILMGSRIQVLHQERK